MIDLFEFRDGNADGDKERVLSATVQLYNKLSADEANDIRDKLNELVTAANFSSVPLYSQFGLKFKGDGNADLQNIEAGDIAHRYSADGVIENARFNGGDPQNPADYTIINNSFEPVMFVTDGLTNEFELPLGFIAKNLFIDRGLRYKNTPDYVGEWDQDETTVEILGAVLAAGKKVYITT